MKCDKLRLTVSISGVSMEKALQRVFEYEGKQIRTVVVDGEPWFVARDVADVLGYANPQKAVRDHCKRVRPVGVNDSFTLDPQTLIIPEPDIYRLVMRSRRPEAERFEEWVVSDVLPSIRKHGLYATDDVVDRILANPDFGIRLLQQYKEERQRRIEAERTNAILMHVNKTYTATEIAKELGFKSAQALNRDLAKRRIQFKQNGTWVLYSDYADRGYTEIKQEVLDSGRVIYHRRWTQLGREFLLRLYGVDKEGQSA